MLQYMYVLNIPGQRSKSCTITKPENLKNFDNMKIIFLREDAAPINATMEKIANQLEHIRTKLRFFWSEVWELF